MDFSFKRMFLDDVAAALSTVAPVLDGRRFLAQNDVPPRYVWVRKRITPAGGPSAIGTNPPSLGDDLHVGEVHCWGTDEDDCERLRRALVTVVRRIVKGRNYELGDAVITEQDWATCGAVLTLTISIRLPLLKVNVPVVPTLPATVPNIVDARRTTMQPTAVGFDADGALPADDVLEADEPQRR